MESLARLSAFMQKTNTLLLVIIVALLAGLLLRPESRRYEVFQQNYLLDTASGRLVKIQVSEEVKADLRAKEAAKEAENKAEEARKKAENDERLGRSCPDVLAAQAPKIVWRDKRNLSRLSDEVTVALFESQQKECQEWLKSRAESKAAESPFKSKP